jgi:hypothetical protein
MMIFGGCTFSVVILGSVARSIWLRNPILRGCKAGLVNKVSIGNERHLTSIFRGLIVRRFPRFVLLEPGDGLAQDREVENVWEAEWQATSRLALSPGDGPPAERRRGRAMSADPLGSGPGGAFAESGRSAGIRYPECCSVPCPRPRSHLRQLLHRAFEQLMGLQKSFVRESGAGTGSVEIALGDQALALFADKAAADHAYWRCFLEETPRGFGAQSGCHAGGASVRRAGLAPECT